MSITYSWINPQGGSWNDTANWNPPGSPQAPPTYFDEPDHATFATGAVLPYTVTGSGVSSLTTISGDHVILRHFTGLAGWNGGDLTVENGGSLRIGVGSRFYLTTHDGLSGGTLTVSDATITCYGSLATGFGTIGDGGRLIFSGTTAGATVLYQFAIEHGGVLRIQNGAHFASSEDTVHGHVLITGLGSWLNTGSLGSTIAADGIVTVSNGGLLTAPVAELQGLIRLAAGNIRAYNVTIDPEGRIVGHGSISGPLTNNGVVAAQGGLLSVEGAVSGTGALAIDSHSTLELGSDTSETIRFRGFDARLMLDHNIGAHGFLGGFSPGDSIDLAGTSVTSIGLKASGHDTLLTAYDHDAVVASFDIGGHIPHGAIALSDDGAGGTLLTYGGCGASVWNDLAQGSSQDAMQAFSHA